MSSHEHFEELCALAASGQLSSAEFAELQAHLNQCDACRTTSAEFVQVLCQGLPLVDPKSNVRSRPLGWWARRSSSRKRFLAQAQTRGFHFSREVWQQESWKEKLFFSFLRPRYATAIVLVLLSTAVGILGFRLWQRQAQWSAALAEEALLHTKISELERTNTQLEEKLTAQTQSIEMLENDLTKARNNHASALAHMRALDELLEESRNTTQVITRDVEQAEQRAKRVEKQVGEKERQLAALSVEIQNLRAADSTHDATITALQTRMNELSVELEIQTRELQRERRLLAASRDIRELMGARNLHIVDVHDVDGRGKTQQSFGRVFYTEGKSLIFYAFDLDEARQTKAKHSYQAWGNREGSHRAAISLGIFYLDNQAQQRWILKYEDPKVLRQINAVFVTVEPFGGGKRPSGRQLLYAYLDNQANHP